MKPAVRLKGRRWHRKKESSVETSSTKENSDAHKKTL
jgi:hypothetical protein